MGVIEVNRGSLYVREVSNFQESTPISGAFIIIKESSGVTLI